MLTPVPVEGFGGLNLAGDPEEVGLAGAVDLLNVDFDRYGRVRSRDGYVKFTSSAATNRYRALSPYYAKAQTVAYLIAGRGTTAAQGWEVLDTAGAVVTSTSTATGLTNNPRFTFAQIGTPTAEYVYVSVWSDRTAAAGSTAEIKRFDGTNWSTPFSGAAETSPVGCILGVSPIDNRLAIGRESSPTQYDSRVRFSDPGAPETFNANNYVDLVPGDGEYITGMVTWGTLLLVFKQTKMFVFYGNSTDEAGEPIFNYRMVELTSPTNGVACASPNGVCFVARDGIYLTTGGPPARVSDKIGPIFTGNPSSLFASSALNQAQTQFCSIAWANHRLYFGYPSGAATAVDRTVVFDPTTDTWSLWNVPAGALCPFRVSDNTDLMFAYASGTNDIGRVKFVSAATDDAGTSITSRYLSGFSDLGSPEREKQIRMTGLVGTGTVTLAWYRDLSSTANTSGNITLGTSPAIARGMQKVSQRGELLAFKISSVSGGAWALNRLEPMVRVPSAPGVLTT